MRARAEAGWMRERTGIGVEEREGRRKILRTGRASTVPQRSGRYEIRGPLHLGHVPLMVMKQVLKLYKIWTTVTFGPECTSVLPRKQI